MNIERLHRILIDLSDDIKNLNIVGQINTVQGNLKNMASQPNQPTFQTAFVDSRKGLYETLGDSAFNTYSPGWKEVIYEIGGRGLLGNELLVKMVKLFDENNLTPANASAEFTKLSTDFAGFNTAIETMISGMEGLDIGTEELKPGDCELGYVIPRLFVENKLSSFDKEVGELNFILNNISEAVTGKKQEFTLKSISSSDFLLYLILGLHIADVLGKAIDRILNTYKSILEIKELKNRISKTGVPASSTKGINTYVNGLMKKEIKAIAKETVNEHYKGEEGRKNELENGLVFSFNKLANRIDKGFNIEIRVEPLPAPKDEAKPSKPVQNKMDLISSIQKSARNIEHIDTIGESILKLPENNKKTSISKKSPPPEG